MLTPSSTSRRPGRVHCGVRVPYITRWSGERSERPRVTVRRGRLAYVRERSYDRDPRGVLWTRLPSQPGKGKPEFGKVHALRQRLAMERLLCQVCGGPSDSSADGVLWLHTEDPDTIARLGSESIVTENPPVCAPCAREAVEKCPRMRREHTVLRVRDLEPAGVSGALYRPVPQPYPVDVASVAYDDPRILWIRAGKLLHRLTHYSVVDLDADVRGTGSQPSRPVATSQGPMPSGKPRSATG